MELALIEWEDSLGCPQGWQSFEDVAASHVVIRSVGWVLRSSERSVTLAPHLGSVDGEENQGQGIMTIPRSCILSWTVISPSSEGCESAQEPMPQPT